MATKACLSEADAQAARERRLDMQHLNMIEGNPLTPKEIEMFEMFERECWTHEQRFAYLDQCTRKMLEKSASA